MNPVPGIVDNFVGGAFVPPAGGEYLSNPNPATGEELCELARSSEDDVSAAVEAAHAALRGPWGHTEVEDRARVLDAIADRIEERFDELVRLEALDTGKPVHTARNVDIARAVSNFRFYAGAVRHYSTDTHSMPGGLNYTLRRRLGVVATITPWNLPLYLLSWKVAPALAMGNAVVAKPSEVTPLTAHALADIAQEVGLPAGVLNVVHGLGSEMGDALTGHPGVKAVSFTGGTVTGHRVALAAARNLTKTSLELGGKNPTIVFADADMDVALDGVLRASIANQGQVCLCGERLFVHRSRLDEVVDGLAARARALRIGDPLDPATRFGSQVSDAHRDKIERYVQLARDEGGEVVCGGVRPQITGAHAAGAWFTPTLIRGLEPTARVATEEVFGPVVTVHPFDDDAEVVELANAVEYGLSASIWTRDLRRAHTVAAALDVGTVWVNTWLKRDLRVPFGGTKKSGQGREGGRYSLEFFSEPKNVCIELGA